MSREVVENFLFLQKEPTGVRGCLDNALVSKSSSQCSTAGRDRMEDQFLHFRINTGADSFLCEHHALRSLRELGIPCPSLIADRYHFSA